jgi:hypothetical protein
MFHGVLLDLKAYLSAFRRPSVQDEQPVLDSAAWAIFSFFSPAPDFPEMREYLCWQRFPEIEKLVGLPPARTASFINPLTVLCHDVGFSNLTGRRKRLCWATLSPITLAGYAFHRAGRKGEKLLMHGSNFVDHQIEERQIISNQSARAAH